MSTTDPPIGPEEAERLLAPCGGFRAVLLAVSGGVDSVAMMLLAARWRAARDEGPALMVATVDHGLRPESAGEAVQVAGWARALGLPHQTLPWTGAKPAAAIQERAREARYGLLAAHAEAVGADALATAHHADDQAETVLMRLARGSGPAGLAGMAPHVARGGLAHLRPLLSIPKARLAATLQAAGHAHCEDPSNVAPVYARNRMRALLASLAAEGLDRDRLLVLARRMARADEALARAAAEAYARCVSETPHGLAIAPALFREPAEIRLRALMQAVASVRGGGAPLRLERAEALEDALSAAAACNRRVRATLGGCILSLDAAGQLSVRREEPRKRGGFRQA